MNEDLQHAQKATEDANVFANVAITAIKREDVDVAESNILQAIDRLTATLVHLRNFRVC